MTSQLLDTQQAFDSVAGDYDGPLGNNALIQRMRDRTMDAVTARIPSGSSVLDLGCGTGLDAEFLARKGYRVTAVDWSPEMVRRAALRIDAADFCEIVRVRQLGIHEIDQLRAHSFAGAYSNLGPLNCVPDLADVARSLANVLQPGGMLIASVIGRVCPWEVALFTLKGQWARARIRFAKGLAPVPLNGRTVWTRYYAPGEFESVFAAEGFRRVSLRALGLLVPPPYMDAFGARHPRLTNVLQGVEDRIAGWPVLRGWGDHFLIVLQNSD